jgi:predicted ATP-binding protein involved in virulence
MKTMQTRRWCLHLQKKKGIGVKNRVETPPVPDKKQRADGLRGIIGWLVHALVMIDVWLQGKADPTNTEAVFLLDEIESHLHPAWQRKILPAFQRLFPKSQIFVATHSPFVISSLNHGWIHN